MHNHNSLDNQRHLHLAQAGEWLTNNISAVNGACEKLQLPHMSQSHNNHHTLIGKPSMIFVWLLALDRCTG